MSTGKQKSGIKTTDSAWKTLYYIGGTAALIAVVVFRRNYGAEFVISKGFGIFNVPDVIPISAGDWFNLLQAEPFVGLVLFEFLDVVNYALVGLIFLALYGAMRHENKSIMLIATTFAFVGIAVQFASNPAFAMLNLSNRFATATTEAEQALFLAAGEALLAIYNPGLIHQGSGYYISLLLVLLSGLLISLVMLRSRIFNKVTAITGILANVFGLGYFVALAFSPAILWLPPTISAPFRLIWYILIAIKLFQLGAKAKKNL